MQTEQIKLIPKFDSEELETNKASEVDARYMMLNIDMRDIDTAGYLGVLISVNVFYLSLMILLTWIVVYVRNKAIHGPNNSLSR